MVKDEGKTTRPGLPCRSRHITVVILSTAGRSSISLPGEAPAGDQRSPLQARDESEHGSAGGDKPLPYGVDDEAGRVGSDPLIAPQTERWREAAGRRGRRPLRSGTVWRRGTGRATEDRPYGVTRNVGADRRKAPPCIKGGAPVRKLGQGDTDPRSAEHCSAKYTRRRRAALGTMA